MLIYNAPCDHCGFVGQPVELPVGGWVGCPQCHAVEATTK